jgi:hypothetical protein
MSALHPKVDVAGRQLNFRFVPIADTGRLHSITSSARSRNDSEIFSPSVLGSLEIDDQLEFGRLLDW